MNLRCIPQNNMDCWYNGDWNTITKTSKKSSDNFTETQNTVNKFIRNYVIGLKYSRNNIENNIIKFRESILNNFDKSNDFSKLAAEISNINSIPSLSNVIKKLIEIDIPTLFSAFVTHNHTYSDKYVLHISSPDIDDSRDINSKIEYYKLICHYKYLNKLWGYQSSSPSNFAYNVIAVKMIISMYPINDEKKISEFLGSMTYDKFIKKYDHTGFWKLIFTNYMNSDDIITYDNIEYISFLDKLLQIIDDNIYQIMRDYLMYIIADCYHIYTTDLHTIHEPQFVNLYMMLFGPYIQEIYEQKFRDPVKETMIHEMFLSISKTCKKMIKNCHIFEDSTKKIALQKLNNMRIIIGSNNCHIDITKMPILGNNFISNVNKINKFYFIQNMSFISKPVKRHCLSFNNDTFSFIVNAYYDPTLNSIYIPTSILTDTFIDKCADPVYNYGSMGCIIGHELMHSFDDCGSQYDQNGKLNNWWTVSDTEKYQKESDKIKNHYSNIRINNKKINSDLSIGENMADIFGIKLSLRTYIDQYMPDLIINNMTPCQKLQLGKFFGKWTETLRSVIDDKTLQKDIRNDVHSPNIIRVNAPFSHISEYYHVYDILPSDVNYLDKEKRSSIFD